MRKLSRMQAAQQVIDHLVPTELALDDALARAAGLIVASIEARIKAKLPLHCGHEAIMRMSNVVGFIIQARTELIEVHSELVETKILVGLGSVSYGDLGRCSPVSGDGDQSVVNFPGK